MGIPTAILDPHEPFLASWGQRGSGHSRRLLEMLASGLRQLIE